MSPSQFFQTLMRDKMADHEVVYAQPMGNLIFQNALKAIDPFQIMWCGIYTTCSLLIHFRLCGVIKNVTNPGDCSSAERCILAYLYDMFTWCKLEKVGYFVPKLFLLQYLPGKK